MTIHDRPTPRQRLEYATIKVVGRLVSLLPAVVGINAGLLLGAAAARLIPIRRKVVDANLRIAFGDSLDETERARLVREAYKTLGMFAMESAYLRYASPEWVAGRVVEMEGFEAVQELLKGPRPVMTFSGHLGNWELLGAAGGRLFPSSPVAKPIHNRLLHEDTRFFRERHGLDIIWSDQPNTPRAILKAVRAGRVVHFFVDQDMRTSGIFVPFFGRPASTTPAPAVLALKTDALLVPAFLIRLGPTRHRMVFRPAIDPRTLKDVPRDERAAELTRRMVAEIEDMVRLYPAQYFWFHRRWKTTPEKVERRRESQARRRQRKTGGQPAADSDPD